MERQSKLKQLFRYRKNSNCFNCPDRRVNCHAHCERYQKEVAENNAEKAEVMQKCQLGWDWGGIKQAHFLQHYKRFTRR